MSSESRSTQSVQAAWRRFAFLYLTLVALALAAGFAFSSHIYWWWVERFEGPELQKAFGFVVERQTPPEQPWRYVVVSVVEGGRLARAGVRPNDVIACLYHGPGDLWWPLQKALEGREATIRVLQPDELHKGCNGARVIVLAP